MKAAWALFMVGNVADSLTFARLRRRGLPARVRRFGTAEVSGLSGTDGIRECLENMRYVSRIVRLSFDGANPQTNSR